MTERERHLVSEAMRRLHMVCATGPRETHEALFGALERLHLAVGLTATTGVEVGRNWLEELAGDLQRGLGPSGDDACITAVQAALRLVAGNPAKSTADPGPCGVTAHTPGAVPCGLPRGHAGRCGAYDGQTVVEPGEGAQLKDSLGTVRCELWCRREPSHLGPCCQKAHVHGHSGIPSCGPREP